MTNTITIIPSLKLDEMKLHDLVCREADIIELKYHTDGIVYGAWVRLKGEPYMGEEEWFIPRDSFII